MERKEKNDVRWVTELIGDDYIDWHDGIYILSCGMSRGKTTFAVNTFAAHYNETDRKVLYLVNRIALKDKMLSDAANLKNITVKSYQGYGQALAQGEVELNYDAIICDEAHYFIADAEFNHYTNDIFSWLLEKAEEVPVIFMSATINGILDYLKKLKYGYNKLYELPTDYSYVEAVYWYTSQKDIYSIVDTVLSSNDTDKIIYFCASNTSMETFYKHYNTYYDSDKNNREDKQETIEWANKHTNLQYMEFTNAAQNSKFAKDICKPKDEILTAEHGYYEFQSRMLITTKYLDNGIEFKDKNIKHIICDVRDLESAIQCLGRRRVSDPDDKIIFYIRDYQHYNWNTALNKNETNLEEILAYQNSYENWYREYVLLNRESKKRHIGVYQDKEEKWVVNKLMLQKLAVENTRLHFYINKVTTYRIQIINYLGKTFLLKCKDLDKSKYHEDMISDKLLVFLQENEGKILGEKDKKVLINLCNLTDKRGRQQKSRGIIDEYLKKNFKYNLKSTRKTINGIKKTCWIVKK